MIFFSYQRYSNLSYKEDSSTNYRKDSSVFLSRKNIYIKLFQSVSSSNKASTLSIKKYLIF